MQFFEEIEGLVSSKWSALLSLISLIKLEATLAGLSIFPLLLNVLMLLVVLLTVWLSTMVMVGYGIIQAYNSGIIATLAVLLLNGLLLGILLKYLLFNLKQMSFEKTRLHLARHKENDNNDFKKAGDNGDSCDGKNIAVPSE